MRLCTLLFAQICSIAAGIAMLGAGQTPTTISSHQVVAPTVTNLVTAVRPVTRALLSAPQPARAAAAPVRSAGLRRHASSVVRRAVHALPAGSRRVVRPLSTRERLDRAVARLAGYRPGDVQWVLEAKDGHWGTADWYHDVIWISPTVPSDRLYDVVAHEWSHVTSVRPYGGDVDLAIQEMNRYFGGSGVVGAERAADCMALLLGAQWTHYTDCQNQTWRAGARRLLADQRL